MRQTELFNRRRLLKTQYVIAIHLMRWMTNFYYFSFKWTTTAGIGMHPTKAWLSQLANFKNAIWMWGKFRRTICNKIVLNLEKMPHKHMECFQTAFGTSCMNRASVFVWRKRFKEGRKSVGGDDERCRKSKEVGQTVRVTMLTFSGGSGRDSVGRGQDTSNRISGISTRTMHQSTTSSLSQTIWWASRQFLSAHLQSWPCSLWLLLIP